MYRFRLAMALVALCPILPRAEDVTLASSIERQRSDNMTTLVSSLDFWLDEQTDWPRRDAVPRVRLVSLWEATARQVGTVSFQRGRLRGLYDPDRSEILLTRSWNPRKVEDVAVLLHELTHHRLAPHHWYCPAAQELPAYRLQQKWLTQQGLPLDVNWTAVVLDAGCTPRDIHPE